MHSSSKTIGAIAEALAKAQGELTNPEKSLVATIRSPFPRESDQTFRYASLATGLDIVRKALGQYGIATIQTTQIDQAAGQIQLTTLLAHASGEWISSDWPVCPTSETAHPHRMGAALSYARRYALFALVGIAGEDDLDAPDLLVEPSPAINLPVGASRGHETSRNPPRGSLHRPPKANPVLASEASAALREQLIAEIDALKNEEDLALWAHRQLPAKNTLLTADAGAVEIAYLSVLTASRHDALETVCEPVGEVAEPPLTNVEVITKIEIPSRSLRIAPQLVSPLRKPVRARNKAHLIFVAGHPCLVCQRSPCDAHHIKFAEPRALGRKVSDEFAVPLCREHHTELHRYGNETAWWANVPWAPLETARRLWEATLSGCNKKISDIPFAIGEASSNAEPR